MSFSRLPPDLIRLLLLKLSKKSIYSLSRSSNLIAHILLQPKYLLTVKYHIINPTISIFTHTVVYVLHEGFEAEVTWFTTEPELYTSAWSHYSRPNNITYWHTSGTVSIDITHIPANLTREVILSRQHEGFICNIVDGRVSTVVYRHTVNSPDTEEQCLRLN